MVYIKKNHIIIYMNYKNSILFTFLSTIIISIFVYKYAFVNNKPHCNNFITNVYLYLALSFSFVGCFVHGYNYSLNDSKNVARLLPEMKVYTQIAPYVLLSFLVAIGSVIALAIQPLFSKEGFIKNHIIWLVFLSSISLTLYPYFKSIEYSLVLQRVLLMTSILFLTMSSLVFVIPEFLSKTYGIALMSFLLALITIIITELFLLFTGQYTKNLYTYISYFVIILFSIFISYDTSRLFQYAKICVNSPNYPLLSTNLFLDILNIFVRMMGLSR